MESNRDHALAQLRPEVAYTPATPESEVARFQGEVLRPILKLQNPLLLQCLRHSLHPRQLKMDEHQKQAWLQNGFLKAQSLKLQLIGMVTGLFAESEYTFYQQNQQALNKRIVALLAERFRSQCTEW